MSVDKIDAGGRQQQNQRASSAETFNIDMQASGEQQQRQHAVEEEAGQIGRRERGAKPPHDMQMKDMIACDNDRRQRQ